MGGASAFGLFQSLTVDVCISVAAHATPAPSPPTTRLARPPQTTANTLSYSVYNIAANPRVQQRLLAEVDAFGRDRQVGPAADACA
jgi:hypothetical protein